MYVICARGRSTFGVLDPDRRGNRAAGACDIRGRDEGGGCVVFVGGKGERPSQPIGTSWAAKRQRRRADRRRDAWARPIPYTRATTGPMKETRSHPSVSNNEKGTVEGQARKLTLPELAPRERAKGNSSQLVDR
ncbi:hypothetical protein DFH07DRAFT_939658 [Mycena maculata]|uniref:Uncharacterized protein n=1 Tax=Mycena maculata TaxID=230809 RepID=A0AAD7NH46_9AGAR|nr:hypothetical protein DFH07DRAFT_939658 [Mycena maculata]